MRHRATNGLRVLLLVIVAASARAHARDPAQTPFASDSVFNLPLGSGAQWQHNAQLASAGVVIDTVGNWNENIYTSAATDPVVTVRVSGASGGPKGIYRLHIPGNAQPSAPPLEKGGDSVLTVDDLATHTWWSFGEFQWTGPTSAVAGQGSHEPDCGSGIGFDNSNWDQGAGTLRESDLRAGVIAHLLRVEVPWDMLKSYGSNPTDMAPYAWPQTQEDGNGPKAYTGTIYYGVTIGIPVNAREPSDVASNRGANMLWKALQQHGAMVRDSTGGTRNLVFQADQNVAPNDPLVRGMERYGHEILSYAKILINQGPNSVNGGGTPVVPLDPACSD